MKSQFRAVNRFISKVKSTSSIDWISSSGTFQVEDISVAWFSLPQWAFTYFVTADFAQTGKEEIFRIINTSGDTLTYDKRIPVWGYVKPTHAAWASIRVNDVADILNEMSDNIDNFGDINQIDGTQTIKVWGGVFNNGGTVYNVANQTLIVTVGQLVDNTTNYVHFDIATRLFIVTASSTLAAAVCIGSVVVTGWVIGAITDLRPGFAMTYGELTTKLDKAGWYRTWLIPNGLMSSDWSWNEVVIIGAGFIATAMISPYAGAFAPSGYLLCDGAAVSRTTYSILFAAIAPTKWTFTVTIATPWVITLTAHGLVAWDAFYATTTGALSTGMVANTLYYVSATGLTANTFQFSGSRWGSSINTTGSQSGVHTLVYCPYGLWNGSTTFNIPNIKWRTIVWLDNSQAEFQALGVSGWAKTHTLSISEIPAHDHAGTYYSSNYTHPSSTFPATAMNMAPVSSAVPSQGWWAAHNNLQPYITLNYIIKT